MQKRIVLYSGFLIAAFYTVGYAKMLDSIIVQGLSINQPSVLTNILPLKQKTEFTAMDVQKAIKALHHSGLFRDVEFQVVEENDSSATLLLKLVENKICESVEYHGNKKIKQKDLQDKMTLRKGAVLSDGMLFDNVGKIRAAYAKEGYLLADVRHELIDTKMPGTVIVKFSINEGQKVRIKKISFSGNGNITESKLRGKFKTKEHGWFNSGEFKKDLYDRHLDSLILYYQEQGYLDARIVSDSVRYADNNKDIHIDIAVDEGRRYYAGKFLFAGNTVVDAKELNNRIALREGKPFNKQKFEMTKYMIVNAYRDEGYLWVQVQDKNSYRDDTVDVTFSIVEGRPAIVRKIGIKGNEKTRDNVIRRELVLFPGQRYKQSFLEESLRKLQLLNYFSTVNPDLIPLDNGLIDLLFTVEEKEGIAQLTAGANYSATGGLGGQLGVKLPNFRGAGQELNFDLNYMQTQRLFSITFKEPWLLNTQNTFEIALSYNHLWDEQDGVKVNESVEELVQTSIGRYLKWPDPLFYGSIGYEIGYKKYTGSAFFDIPPVVRNKGFTALREGIVSKVLLSLSRVNTDNPYFPSRGSSLGISSGIGGIGGDYSLTARSTIGYNQYFPLIGNFTLGTKVKAGMLHSFGSPKKIDYHDLFTIGGFLMGDDGIVRGYGNPQNPEDDDYNFEEGLTFLTMGTELKYAVLKNQLYLALFSDMGNSWQDVNSINLKDLYPSVGIGVRVSLPMINVIGFDFAWPLRERGPGGTHLFTFKPGKMAINFSMNTGF